MERKSFSLSQTKIEKWASSFRISKQIQEQKKFHDMQSGAKEFPPVYYLKNVDFSETTRKAKLTFKSRKQYRTVERYVTQNYQRYPIYSNWKFKEKYFEKSVKLTNLVLESLNTHEDPLIRDFAPDIIIALHNTELIPSWLSKKILDDVFAQETDIKIVQRKTWLDEFDESFSEHLEQIDDYTSEIAQAEKLKHHVENKISKKNAQLQKIENHKKSAVLSIFTFFIYNLLNSNWRKQRLLKKKETFESNRDALTSRIAEFHAEIEKTNEQINQEKEELKKKCDKIASDIAALKLKYEDDISRIEPLDVTYNENADFVPLKNFNGLEYEKIIGCYIIWNTEKDKYYVGQSKDVMRRIKQHFKGTMPNNIIFAEDYYSSALENKDDLFKIKILPRQTKDELDSTEKLLIEQYDANNSGYNSTKGNN